MSSAVRNVTHIAEKVCRIWGWGILVYKICRYNKLVLKKAVLKSKLKWKQVQYEWELNVNWQLLDGRCTAT